MHCEWVLLADVKSHTHPGFKALSCSYFTLPPWCIKPLKIVFDLLNLKKDWTDACIYKQFFMEIRDRYRDYILVYTDGSWDSNAVASATVFPSNCVSIRLPDSPSVFSAEVWPIIKASDEIETLDASKFIIFTYSLSCLPNFTQYEAWPSLNWAGDTNAFYPLPIVLCWLPGHVGISGNEKPDLAVKPALDLYHTKVGIPYSDFKFDINQYIFSTWQDDWNGALLNKLHFIKPVLGDWQSSYWWGRRDEVMLCHAHIGHTF